ncbi:MAG TPA: hypothetical protein VGP20_06505 [Steroidobacteraceae bacterium]|jgi:hypothetical protein|nr:hypothetical protein [Steroidobacteraceae bacterium]
MSELQLTPEFEVTTDAVRGETALNRAAADSAVRGGAQLRGTRRRIDAARLRAPTDDGYHLFRVY